MEVDEARLGADPDLTDVIAIDEALSRLRGRSARRPRRVLMATAQVSTDGYESIESRQAFHGGRQHLHQLAALLSHRR